MLERRQAAACPRIEEGEGPVKGYGWGARVT
jgi:hypothetical protein